MTNAMYFLAAILILMTECCSDVMAGYYLVMDEQFDSLDVNQWAFEITANGGGNGQFNMYTPETANTFVRDGKLFIKPTLSADKFGEAWLINGTLDIVELYGRCTQAWDNGCQPKDAILYPVMSGRLNSYDSIKYGKVEVIAKLPRGDWLWPAIWMLPVHQEYGSWPASGAIDIAGARGNRDLGNIGINTVESTMHWGPDEAQNKVNTTMASYTSPSATWADGMHNYTLEWSSAGISVYIDSQIVLNVSTPPDGYWTKGGFSGHDIWSSGRRDAPFDKHFYLILSVAVGGVNGFFPDDIPNGGYPKPWTNGDDNMSKKARRDFWAAKDLWYPTWQGDDAAMVVESVKIWQLTAGNGHGCSYWEITNVSVKSHSSILSYMAAFLIYSCIMLIH